MNFSNTHPLTLKSRQRLKIVTLGCSKNRVDSEHLLTQLEGAYQIVPESSSEPVDILLLNTCGFIGDAKEESIQAILEALSLKAEGSLQKVIVFGCLSQRYPQELAEEIPEVDAWFGARDIDPIVEYLGCTPDHSLYRERTSSDCGPGTAYLKISEGCDRRCSYCAIPYIRGAHKSVPIEDLVTEAKCLASKGVKELVLIAQDTTFYGLDLYKKRALASLIEALSAIEGIEWIRIHYSYPASFPQDVLDQMANNPKVCKYLDIPLQHVSDSVLSAMRRQIDGKGTRELIEALRQRIPSVALRTTMMVGHPGEGEQEFRELMEFCASAKFERLGAFAYSEEDGTWGAQNLQDSVDPQTKQARYEALMEQQAAISLEFNQGRVGLEEKVMIDSVMPDGTLVCRSQYDSPEVDGEIYVKAPQGVDCTPGNFIKVKITQADMYDLQAEMIL